MPHMFLQRQLVALHFGTLVNQFMLTRPLSCNVIVVALLFSYLLLFNGLLAGRGDTVIFLQSTDNCMPTSVHQVTYFSVLYRTFHHHYTHYIYQYHSMPDTIEDNFFFQIFITYLLQFIHYLSYCAHFLPCNNRIPLYVMLTHLLPLIIFNLM